MEMLNNENISDIISWTPDGESFTIHDKKRFSSEVLPFYFKGQIKFSSFTRRVNRWKFIMVASESSKSKSVYHHPLFKRDEIQKCSQMKPKPQKKASRRTKSPQEAKEGSTHGYVASTVTYSSAPTTGGMGLQHQHYEQNQRTLVPPQLQFDHCHHLITSTTTSYGQQEMSHHQHRMNTDPSYKELYKSSLRSVYAAHQAQMAMEVELSHLAMMSAMMNHCDRRVV